MQSMHLAAFSFGTMLPMDGSCDIDKTAGSMYKEKSGDNSLRYDFVCFKRSIRFDKVSGEEDDSTSS